MKDCTAAGKQTAISRQEIYEDYVNFYSQNRSRDPQPCIDVQLVMKAGQFLLWEPEPRGRFTTFPFYQAVMEGNDPETRDWRKHLTAFIKATELLEMFCVNLFLQPWKKEIKTLKTFTGPFVYHLLPVLTRSTIQSVLASIGYLPHIDAQHSSTPISQYRLSEDANPDRAMLVGFELLLARVECHHLLELLEQAQPQEWMEVLRGRPGHCGMEEPAAKITLGQEEEKRKEDDRKEEGELFKSLVDPRVKEEEKKKQGKELGAKQWDQSSQVPLSLEARPAVKPQPKPRRAHLLSEDSSIMEMQRNYPDLTIRGHRLLQDKTHTASSNRNISKVADIVSTDNDTDDSKASDYNKSTKAAPATISSKSDSSKVDDIFGGHKSSGSSRNNGSSGCSDSKSSSVTTTQGSRADDGLSGPEAISMHITLRAGTRQEDQTLRPGEPQPRAAPPPWMDHEAAAAEPSSPSSIEEQELKELAERMGQLYVRSRNEEEKRDEENKNKEKRVKEREAKEEDKEEVLVVQSRYPVEEKGPARSPAIPNHGGKRSNISQHDPGVLQECNIPDCKGGAGISRKGGERGGEIDGERVERGGGEDEQVAQSFIIVEHHKKNMSAC